MGKLGRAVTHPTGVRRTPAGSGPDNCGSGTGGLASRGATTLAGVVSLPQPVLCRDADLLPTGIQWAYQLKVDGFFIHPSLPFRIALPGVCASRGGQRGRKWRPLPHLLVAEVSATHVDRGSLPIGGGDEGVEQLWRQGRRGEDLAVFEEVLRRFDRFNEPGVRIALANALLHKGFALERLDRLDEAIGAYEELERRFAEDSDSFIQEDVAEARARRAELIEEGTTPH